MTVAAIVRPSDVAEALADAAGRVGVRRIVDAAWAGGALPIIVVVPDPGGAVAAALAGSPARLLAPAEDAEVRVYRAAAEAAVETVAETSAVLLWPGRMTWVDPETVTSLIEAHGADPDRPARPLRDRTVGWPVLVPASRLPELTAHGHAGLADAVAALDPVPLELGDPGTVLGLDTPLTALPDYAGPAAPVGGPPPEWGAAAADVPDPELAPGS